LKPGANTFSNSSSFKSGNLIPGISINGQETISHNDIHLNEETNEPKKLLQKLTFSDFKKTEEYLTLVKNLSRGHLRLMQTHYSNRQNLLKRTQTQLDDLYMTYLAHQRRINQPTVLDRILGKKCCIAMMPCFHYDPDNLIDRPEVYYDRSKQAMEGYDSTINFMEKNQTKELLNFIDESGQKLMNICEQYHAQLCDKKSEFLEKQQEDELKTISSKQNKQAVDNIKAVKRNKNLTQAEANRQVKEIRQSNAKQHVAQTKMIKDKHTVQLDGFDRVKIELIKEYKVCQVVELRYWEGEWRKVPFRKRKNSSVIVTELSRMNGNLLNTIDQTVRRLSGTSSSMGLRAVSTTSTARNTIVNQNTHSKMHNATHNKTHNSTNNMTHNNANNKQIPIVTVSHVNNLNTSMQSASSGTTANSAVPASFNDIDDRPIPHEICDISFKN